MEKSLAVRLQNDKFVTHAYVNIRKLIADLCGESWYRLSLTMEVLITKIYEWSTVNIIGHGIRIMMNIK